MHSIFEKIELPDRLDPMTVKELRQGLRKGSFLIPFIAIHIFAIAAMFVEFHLDDSVAYDRYTGVMQIFLFFDDSPFWWVAGLVCMVGMPLGALMLMSPEMEEGNYELLQMTPLTRWKIVIGKALAMWFICLLTFSSLLPYMIVRYFVGGMDVWRNFSMALTVILASAIICAGALAASSFKGAVKRGLVLALFATSALISGMLGLGICAQISNSCGVFYHINAICFVLCYILLGLVMARSRIRLTVHHYEVKPSWMVIGLLIFTPLVVGIATLVSFGWLSGLGFVVMGIVSRYADVSPKAPAYKGLANTNIPAHPRTAEPHLPQLNSYHKPEAVALIPESVKESAPIVEVEEVMEPVEENLPNPLAALPKPTVQKPLKKYPKVDKDSYDGWK